MPSYFGREKKKAYQTPIIVTHTLMHKKEDVDALPKVSQKAALNHHNLLHASFE
jgi:hypothetical protein